MNEAATPGRAAPRTVGVRRLSEYLKAQVDENPRLRGIGVCGEISNLRPYPSGTVWFDLGEDGFVLSCVAWSDAARRLPRLENGQSVTAFGAVTAYAKKSRYQLSVRNVTVAGAGDVHRQYEELKRKLDAEGLFDRPKRQLPRFPFRVALVSSPGADGYNDFVRILADRAPHVRIILCETPVQGIAATIEIAEAIRAASKLDVDVIVVARGGGSAEDIYAFSQEAVVRAVALAAHPIVTAIGHAKDVPLCDLVADRRAETPSNAAALLTEVTTAELRARVREVLVRIERRTRKNAQDGATRVRGLRERAVLAVPGRVLGPFEESFDELSAGLSSLGRTLIERRRTRFEAALRRLERRSPSAGLADRRRRIDLAAFALARLDLVALRGRRVAELARRLDPAVRNKRDAMAARARLATAKLTGNDPTAILQRGYAIVESDGQIVRDAAAVPVGATIRARLSRGSLLARVERSDHHDG